jgi:hypothetical protein
MIERIGGEVDVAESRLGGAQFRVRLPLILSSDESSNVPGDGAGHNSAERVS